MPFIDYKPFPREQRCFDLSHNPPTMILLHPGTHTYQCPSCGKQTVFMVPEITCNANGYVTGIRSTMTSTFGG